MSLFATKPISRIIAEAEETGAHTLKKTLSALDLTMLGIGGIIGTGIFVLTGQAAGKHAGPAVILSMILAGIVSAFAALCYSEFAASVPISGSAYAYGYGTLGEFVAWIIGWDLILEYAFGAATVAVGWSGYVNSLLQDVGIHLPPALTASPGTELVLWHDRWHRLTTVSDALGKANVDPTSLQHATASFDLVALLVIFLVTT